MLIEESITQVFFSFNYKKYIKAPDYGLSFIKELNTNLGNFTILFKSFKLDLTDIPKVYLVSRPKQLNNKILSHLNPDQTICYLDKEQSNLFPLNPVETIYFCITQVESIIKYWESDEKNIKEIQQEFSSYWQSKYYLYAINTSDNGYVYQYQKKNLNIEKIDEYVAADNLEQSIKWIQSRKANEHKQHYPFFTIKINNSLWVPSNINWPIESFNDLTCWLKKIDIDAYYILIAKLVNYIDKKAKIVILFKQDYEYFAVQILFSKTGLQLLNRQKKITKNKGRFKQLPIARREMVINFTRLMVEDSSDEFIFQRNQTDNHTLINKNIALIGCGTIGGYASQALVQVGAGGGKGILHLFDEGLLSTGNLGRHILGHQYLQEHKSQALKHYLGQLGFPVTIKYHQKFNKEDINKNWDLIINATGDDNFSLLLSSWFHQYQNFNFLPVLIHSWIDAYGKAVRALKEYYNSACYCCLSEFNNHERIERFSLFNKMTNEELHQQAFRRKCNETYLPFSSQASLTSAGMIQAMALEMDNKKSPTFQQIALNPTVNHCKDQILSKLKKCPLCSKKS